MLEQNILDAFTPMMPKDDRIYLLKTLVNTLLASSLANEHNGLFKLSNEDEDKLTIALNKSNRFNDEQKTKLKELADLCRENSRNLRQLSITFGPKATIDDALDGYISAVRFDGQLHDKSKPIDLDF